MKSKVSKFYWVITIIGLLWNAMGVYQFLVTIAAPKTYADTYNEAPLTLIENLPDWYLAIYAIAVFTALLGCLFLMLKNTLAIPSFLLSVCTIIIMFSYWLFFTDAPRLFGSAVYFMPLVVFVIALALYFFSRKMKSQGVLK